jgi:hypothetical protein
VEMLRNAFRDLTENRPRILYLAYPDFWPFRLNACLLHTARARLCSLGRNIQ